MGRGEGKGCDLDPLWGIRYVREIMQGLKIASHPFSIKCVVNSLAHWFMNCRCVMLLCLGKKEFPVVRIHAGSSLDPSDVVATTHVILLPLAAVGHQCGQGVREAWLDPPPGDGCRNVLYRSR